MQLQEQRRIRQIRIARRIRRPWSDETDGIDPQASIPSEGMAGSHEVRGSIPLGSTIHSKPLFVSGFFFLVRLAERPGLLPVQSRSDEAMRLLPGIESNRQHGRSPCLSPACKHR